MELKAQITQAITAGERFSLSLDEWSSVGNKRYLGIVLHSKQEQNRSLGLVRMTGYCNAERILDMINLKLKTFDISFKNHIVAVTTDGASVMKKLGSTCFAENMLCLNHAIHLAVVDVFYKVETNSKCNKGKTVSGDSDDFEDDDDGYIAEDDDIDEDDNDDSASIEDDIDVNDDDVNSIKIVLSREDVSDAINNTRNVIKYFRKSPTKNEILQKYVKEEFSREYCLLLDVKTRWNSLVLMIERFLKLKNCVKKSLIDLNLTNIWKEEHIFILETTFNILKPIKVAVEALRTQIF